MNAKTPGLAAGLCVLLLAGCDGPAVQGGQDDATTPVDNYALRPLADTWPTIGEDAAPSTAVDAPVANYYMVFDGSGSMAERDCTDGRTKIEVAQEAVERFVSAVPESAKLGLFVFDANGESERVPLALGNRDAFVQAIRATEAREGTPLRTAITAGFDKLTDEARAQFGYGEYHLVVITDGQPSSDADDPTPIVQRIFAESPVVLHTIGFCIGANHVLNQPGRSYYVAADSQQALEAGLESVLAESESFDVSQFPAATGGTP